MLELTLTSAGAGFERVLAIGCHADDIEIGCGGTLLALLEARPHSMVTWVVLSAPGSRAAEARSSAEAFLSRAEVPDVRVFELRESFFPYIGADVKEVFETFKDLNPDLVLTHTRSDLPQDHRLACELTWNTFRDHLILEYEIPKYDGDLGSPNLFVPLTEDVVERKLRLITEHFSSQSDRHWFDEDVFRGLMRLRGMESVTRNAEAFVCRKLRLALA
jgi:LmbE family N-acetylglucosaminyl deacetylase